MPIVMSSRRPAALSRGATAKARSAAIRSALRALRDLEQRADAGHAAAGADALQALRDQHAVVGIERHDVGDRAQGHQVEQLAPPRARPAAGRRSLQQRRCSAAIT